MHIGPPTKHRSRWRCLISIEGCRQWGPTASTPARAQELARLSAQEALRGSTTVSEAIDAYLAHQREKGNREGSVITSGHVLRRYFSRLMDKPLAMLTADQCRRLYESLTAQLAVDTHRNYLSQARTFCAWLQRQGTIRQNPLAQVEAVGRRQHGKTQLRLDEARRLKAAALHLAEQGDDGALAVLLALLCGMRASEICSRTVRDLDNGSTWLWIGTTARGFAPKSRAGHRHLEIPPELVPLLRLQAQGKQPDALLFAGPHGRGHWRDWPNEQTARLCEIAGVPKVCAHSLRGLHATLGVQAGVSPLVVAAALGHEHVGTTLRSYAQPGTLAARQAEAVRELLN